MRFFFVLASLFLALSIGFGIFHQTRSDTDQETALSSHGTFIEGSDLAVRPALDPYATWQRPPGAPRVGLQVGHWKNSELPDEFERLRESGGGTNGGGKAEWEVTLTIAELVASGLREQGVIVDILPATIPPAYWADVLLAIHADGNLNSAVSGYKVAAPRRDRTGTAEELASLLEDNYGTATALPLDTNITRNMTGYYAFNWRRYEHAMHPMTAAAIIETGFLTSPVDRKIIVAQPQVSAKGITDGILTFLATRALLAPT